MYQTELVRIACIYLKEKTNDTQSNPRNKTTEATYRCDLCDCHYQYFYSSHRFIGIEPAPKEKGLAFMASP